MSLLLSVLDGRISLKGVLGAGGMGEVHRAWDAALERPVAVKFVRSSDPKEAERLVLEARLQSRVEHPNVVRVYDTGTLDGRSCILLQLVEGQTFADLRTGVDWRAKVQLAAQAARGLGAAHRTGLVHRDVKPANILVEETEQGLQALLSDFGLAKDEEGGLTRSGLMMGTVDFMAPEQVTGVAPVDFRADIYGLGATLYAVLAGRPPFRDSARSTAPGRSTEGQVDATGEAETHPGDLLRRVLEEDPKPLSAEVPDLPKDLSVVIAKAMEKEPMRRYTTAEALADDLERVLQGEAIQARSVSWLERGARWTQRNPIPARVLGAGLIAVLAATAFAAWNNRRSTLASLEAAELGGEAKAFELRLKMAYLAPAHDLRPVHAELREGLVRLAGRRGAGSAAADYARGRVFFLLDDLDQARVALEAALVKGFKGSELHAALGLTYGRIYERDLPSIEALQDPDFRARRLLELQRRLRAPALAHLSAAGQDLLIQAEVAFLNGHYDETRRLALEARHRDPERPEAALRAARVWLREGREAYNQRNLERAQACAAEGLAVAQGLIENLRSDPAVPILLGGFKDLQASVLNDQGKEASRQVAEGMAFAEQALALDADSRQAWTLKIRLLATAAQIGAQKDQDSLARSKTLLEAARRLVALDPNSARAHQLLSYGLYAVGHETDSRGGDPAAFHLEGFKAGLEADRLEPWNAWGLYRALLNAIQHIQGQIKRGKDPTQLLAAAEDGAGRLEKLEGRGGLHPNELLGTLANFKSSLGQVAWLQGRDPDPYQAEAIRIYETLQRAEPDRTDHLAYICWLSQQRMDNRIFSGREVESIFQSALPVAHEAIRRTPNQPMLKAYRAALYIFSLFGRVEGRPMALDAVRRNAAQAAMAEAKAGSRHPALLETQGMLWLAEAEAGLPGAADKALREFEAGRRAKFEYPSTRISAVRALRIRKGPGDLLRALAIIEKERLEAPNDPDLMLFQGVALKDLGRVAEAAPWLAKALAAQPLLAGHPILHTPFMERGPFPAAGGLSPVHR